MSSPLTTPPFGGPDATPAQQDEIRALQVREVNAARIGARLHDAHGKLHAIGGNADELLTGSDSSGIEK